MDRMRKYRDVTIELSDPDPNDDCLRVALYPWDAQPVEPMRVPVNRAEIERWLDDWPKTQTSQEALLALGERLGSCLLPPGIARSWFQSAFLRIEPSQGIRLRLVVGDPPLARWPWELARLSGWGDPSGTQGFLALDPRISVVRLVPEAKEPAFSSQRSADWLHVLVAMASPSDRDPIDQDLEQQVLARALSKIKDQGSNAASIKSSFLPNATIKTMQSAVLLKQPQVFHFAGHAASSGPGPTFMATDADAYIVLMSERGSTWAGSDLWPAGDMARMLASAGTRLVVLGACGQSLGQNKAWTSVAHLLVKLGPATVVALQHDLKDEPAVAFFAGLYGELAAGLTIDEAVSTGRLQAMQVDDGLGAGWAAPVVWTQPGSGAIFPELTMRRAEMDANVRISVQQNVETTKGTLTGVTIGKIG